MVEIRDANIENILKMYTVRDTTHTSTILYHVRVYEYKITGQMHVVCDHTNDVTIKFQAIIANLDPKVNTKPKRIVCIFKILHTSVSF